MNRFLRPLLFSAIAASAATPAFAVDLTIVCHCIEGGTDNAEAVWLKRNIIPEFSAMMKAKGKDVSVSLKEFGGEDDQFAQQLALDFSTKSGSDVSGFDGFLIPGFVDGGLLKPLNQVAGAEVDSWEGWKHIGDGSRALMSYAGQTYGLAVGTDVRMILTRKDLLAKAGIKADGWQPKSWDDLLEAARALKKADPSSFPLQLDGGTSMGEATTMQGYYMALLGTGESVRDDSGKWIVSSPGILDTLNLYKTIYVDEALGDQRAQLLADGRNRTFANFRDGKTALLIESDWFYSSVTAPGTEFGVTDRDKVVGWAKMPAKKPGAGFRGQDFVTISGGTGFVINPNTKYPAESWALLAFMNGKDQLAQYQKLEEAVRIRDDVPIQDSKFLRKAAAELLPLTTARPNDPNYAKVSTEIQRMTEAVISGELSPADAMAHYKAAVTAIVGADNTISLN